VTEQEVGSGMARRVRWVFGVKCGLLAFEFVVSVWGVGVPLVQMYVSRLKSNRTGGEALLSSHAVNNVR
jgi:hypothetical protein